MKWEETRRGEGLMSYDDKRSGPIIRGQGLISHVDGFH